MFCRVAARRLDRRILRATVRGADRGATMTTQDDMVREFFLGFTRFTQ